MKDLHHWSREALATKLAETESRLESVTREQDELTETYQSRLTESEEARDWSERERDRYRRGYDQSNWLRKERVEVAEEAREAAERELANAQKWIVEHLDPALDLQKECDAYKRERDAAVGLLERAGRKLASDCVATDLRVEIQLFLRARTPESGKAEEPETRGRCHRWPVDVQDLSKGDLNCMDWQAYLQTLSAMRWMRAERWKDLAMEVKLMAGVGYEDDIGGAPTVVPWDWFERLHKEGERDEEGEAEPKPSPAAPEQPAADSWRSLCMEVMSAEQLVNPRHVDDGPTFTILTAKGKTGPAAKDWLLRRAALLAAEGDPPAGGALDRPVVLGGGHGQVRHEGSGSPVGGEVKS